MSVVLNTDWRTTAEAARGGTVALGNFDGVHLGHRAVLRAAHAARPDLTLQALTFEPHPREHFRPGRPALPADAGFGQGHGTGRGRARIVHALAFDAALASMSAGDFVEHVLHRALGAKHLACGADFAFGNRRGGDVAFLAREAEARGIGLSIVPAVTDAEGPITSTRIRRALQDGYPDRAAEMLGHPWAIESEVVHGDKLGRVLGWPTANMWIGRHLEPARARLCRACAAARWARGAGRGQYRPAPDAGGRPADAA